MIVNKFIIVLCIIFLILLLRKLSYENFQSSTTSVPQTTSVAPPIKFSDTINYNCSEIDKDEVCDFLESASICKNTSSGCKPACRFNINDPDFLREIDLKDSTNNKFTHCLEKCQIESDNSYCNNQDCIDVCNNLNLKSTEGLIRYRDRGSETQDTNYEKIVNRIQNANETDPLIQKILDPLKSYSDSQNSVDKEEELKEKIKNLNSATGILSKLSDTNIETSKDIPQKMMNHLENLLRKKRKLNQNLDYNVKANMIKEKINRIKQLTDYFSEQGETKNSSNKMHGVFKSIKCLANGQTLNIEPVIKSSPDGLYVKREGEYLIQVNKKILFYELRNTNNDVTLDDGTIISSGMVCRGELNDDGNTSCKYVPTNGHYVSNNGDLLNNNIKFNGDVVDETQWNHNKNDRNFNAEMQKIGAYFYVKKISNETEYNNVIKSAGNLNYETGLIKYPFYIIQPTQHKEKCLNLKKTKTGINIVTIEKCSNKPTERFDSFVYSSYNPNCQSDSS
jgi:hypothetical protein